MKRATSFWGCSFFRGFSRFVNRYIEQNRDALAIYKLRNNIPLTALNYNSLEHIFTGELGTAEDYQREFQNTPFGLLVRKVAKLEYEAAIAELTKPPFDKPQSFVKLFDGSKQKLLVATVNQIKENAVKGL